MNKNIHVVPDKANKQWKVKQENSKRSSGNFSTQKEAFERARKIAKKNGQEVITHGKNGQIRSKESYGDDPFPPKG